MPIGLNLWNAEVMMVALAWRAASSMLSSIHWISSKRWSTQSNSSMTSCLPSTVIGSSRNG